MLQDMWGKEIKTVGRGQDFQRAIARMSIQEYERIRAELRSKLALVEPGKATAASWIPGHDWTGTVYEPIYTKACQRNYDASAMLFGQIFKLEVIHHGALWSTVKQPKHKDDPDGVEIALYWRHADSP